MSNAPAHPHLSVIIPTLYEVQSANAFLRLLCSILDDLEVSYEVIIVGLQNDDEISGLFEHHSIRLIKPEEGGYGGALLAGFAAAKGDYVLTTEPHLASSPDFAKTLWEKRDNADVVVASRYVPGARLRRASFRHVLSYSLNVVFARGLNLRIRDMSSGFRLYNAAVLHRLSFSSKDFSILEEILTKVYCEGYTVAEVPLTSEFSYRRVSFSRMLSFGFAYLRTFLKLYRLRNSILSADYDDRAYDSIVLPQRYWQRRRFQYVVKLIAGQGPTLDVGCGSSRIIQALPDGSVALDILIRKLRYARKFKTWRLQASGFHLPVGDASFLCVLCSQVIEHVPKESPILNELCRVLAPGGRLVLGTPDYANWEWRLIEAIYARVLPSAYADEHIAHYTRRELINLFAARGYTLESVNYILRGELILAFRKPLSDINN
ncbi:MAG TPA: methyltransferase domain-containing protein [Aggregatilineales bacterium]|nr:methyltransferase domain-containing protein [Aggregatilineales bacterium]